ncbi:MAG: Hsp20/alpha crystallin family protein [Thermoprotei archaeon]|nr:MAG: Hsp20/alpha crystallin family protein [Thermoprotei archaeon]
MEEFDRWLRRWRKFMEDIDRMFDELFREAMKGIERGVGRPGCYYYGFSITIGPDGVPKIREWGNIRPGIVRPKIMEAIEPFYDIVDEGDKLKIIVEMPGVEKEDIRVKASEDKVIVSAEREDRKYYREIELPTKVIPKTAKAQYRNGVLTITVEKKEKPPKPEEGFEVRVE